MGVDIQTWCEVVRRHPVKYKFHGFQGWHESVGDAAAFDERFMDQWMADIEDPELDGLESDISKWKKTGEIGEMLEDFVEFYDIDLEAKDEDEGEDAIWELDHSFEHSRWEWSASRNPPEWQWEFLRSGDYDEMLFEKHWPEEVLEHASGCGVPVENVLAFCPSCGHEPIDDREVEPNGHHFYCGLCGCEFSTRDDEPTLIEFLRDDYGATIYPFKGGK